MEEHKISLWTAILMNINTMVGVGIFFGPAIMAKTAGYASFLAWPLVALIFLPVVLSIAKISRIFPGAGSFYNYSKNIINPTAGFISGFTFFLGYTGVTALMAILLRGIVSNIFKANFGFDIDPVLFNILFIGGISILSLASIKTIARIQNIGTFLKVFPLLFVLAVFLFHWNPSFTITSAEISILPRALPLAIFGFWGFECCCAISHLISGKKSNASTAILVAFGLTALIYTLFHIGLLHIMGLENLVNEGSQEVGKYLLLPASLKAILFLSIKLAMVLAFANAVLSLFTANTATLRTMASENLFPYSKQICLLNNNQRPWVAIIVQAVLTFTFATLLTNTTRLASLTNIGIIITYLFTMIALLIIQNRTKEYGQMIITGLGFISLTIFTVSSWFDMGTSTLDRAISLLPLIITFAVGFGMFLVQTKCCKK